MVLGAPPPFYAALAALQKEESWAGVRAKLFEMWTTGVEERAVHDFVATMASFGFDMWARAGREIAASFARTKVPIDALATLGCPVLHVYAQPADPAFLAAQEEYRASHPWFDVRRVAASSHFPTIEAPAEVAQALESFARTLGR
jgi:pimeloyl-ACP methyl ester carboxylesterase